MHQSIEHESIKTIEGVLRELDAIIEETVKENSSLGIFAYVYRRTTFEIQKAIEDQRFEDNERMVRFDVAFANYYLNAYHHHREELPTSLCWKRAFEYSHRNISILQHILLGMNAHINLDLGIAAAKISKDKNIELLKNDFFLVNQILTELIDEIQLKISRVSPLMFILDWIGGRQDEKLISFNIKKARHHAWRVACTLAKLKDDPKRNKINQIDRDIAHLAYQVYKPQLPLIKVGLKLLKIFEEKNIAKIIDKLSY